MSAPGPAPFKNPRAAHGFKGRTCSIVGGRLLRSRRVLTNAELERMVDTTDEWITVRTGIKERHMRPKTSSPRTWRTQAALRAMESAQINREQIDLIIVATITPDMPFPSTACLVQRKIGAHRAAAFDLEAACSGFIYGLEIGQQFIMSRTYDTVLVIGAEKLSSIIDWSDRNTCVLFGDGAGAAILQNRPNSHGLLTACMGADGDESGSAVHARRRQPLPGDARNRSPIGCITCAWKAKRLSRTRSSHVQGGAGSACAAAKWISARSNASSRTRPIGGSSTPWPSGSGPNPEQLFINLHKYGNTSAASVAIALDEAVQSGRIAAGRFDFAGGFRRRADLGRGRN